MTNDRGGWVIECRKCQQEFTVRLRNPEESAPKDFVILKRFDDEQGYGGSAPPAAEQAQFSLDMNANLLRFKYEGNPIYRCTKNGEELERRALALLRCEQSHVHSQLTDAQNYALSSKVPDVEHAVVRIGVPCTCGDTHLATFYFPFRLDLSVPPEAEEMLLADVQGTSLEDELTGIFSKSFLMDTLEKLVIRWRLKFDQIVIASPFIAHQFLKKHEKLEIWEWLLGILDAGRTTFITRSASYKEYKSALLESGLDYDQLANFGLENRMVGAGDKKQDFHAKVYIGLGENSEVFSGSANLVRGPSFENATFMNLSKARVDKRYLQPLGVQVRNPNPRSKHHLLIIKDGGKDWRSSFEDGTSPFR